MRGTVAGALLGHEYKVAYAYTAGFTLSDAWRAAGLVGHAGPGGQPADPRRLATLTVTAD